MKIWCSETYVIKFCMIKEMLLNVVIKKYYKKIVIVKRYRILVKVIFT